MTNTKRILPALFATALVGTMAFAAIASADTTTPLADGEAPAFQGECRGGHGGEGLERGPRLDEESMEALKSAIESGDFDAWYSLTSEQDNPHAEEMLEVINETNFSLMAEMMEARENRDFEAMQAIHEELGLEMRGPRHQALEDSQE